MATLQIYDGSERIRDVDLGREPLTLGRDDTNTLVLEDASVSRRHAEIEPTGNFFVIRDHGSTNGTFVNDMLVRVHLLAHGDVIRVGRYILRIDARSGARKESTRVRVEQLGIPGVASSGGSSDSPETLGGEAPVEIPACLGFLDRLGAAIGHVEGRDELLSHSLEFLLEELAADHASVLLAETPISPGAADPSLLTIRTAFSREEDGDDSEVVIPEQALERALSGPDVIAFPAERDSGPDTMLLGPLVDRGLIRGIACVDHSRSGHPFSEVERRLLAVAVTQLAIGLANADLFESMGRERKKVQAIFTGLSDGVLVTDDHLTVTDSNIAATVLLGCEASNPVGRPLFELLATFALSPDPALLVDEALESEAVFRMAPAGGETGGSRRHLLGRLSAYPRGGDVPCGFVLIVRDATELRRLEQLKGEFVSNVAHKLRTPLTVIEANLPLLEEAPDAPELRGELLDEVTRNSNLLCHLVDQFVEFSELELGSAANADPPRPTGVDRLIAGAMARVSALADGRGIRLGRELEDGLPTFELRAGRISQAISRVLENAIKFSPEGSDVVVSADVDGEVLHIHVDDEGPGIPPEHIDAVFYVGHQVDREGTGQVPGAGLGLPIVRHILLEEGGDVRIRSPRADSGAGTRVTFRLPLERAPVREPDLGSAHDAMATSRLEVGHGGR